MRSDLDKLEQIDQYLSGKMSPAEATAFEGQMNADPALKSLVDDQQLLIQTVNRQALMTEINSVASAAGGAVSTGFTALQWAITGVGVLGAIVGGIFIYQSVTAEPEPVEPSEEIVQLVEQDETNHDSDTGEFMSFEIQEFADEEEEEELGQIFENYDDHEPSITYDNNDLSVSLGGDDSYLGEGPEEEIIENEDKPEVEIENKVAKNRIASYAKGRVAMKKFIKKNLRYPITAKNKKIEGTVRISFFVDKDGKIIQSNITSECYTMRGENGKPLNWLERNKNKYSKKCFENEARRLFIRMPRWIPATNSYGAPILTSQTWRVNFKLNDESSTY